MAHTKAWLTKRCKRPDGKWVFGKPAFTGKTRMLSNRVISGGREFEWPGIFILEWYQDGRRERRRLTSDPRLAQIELDKQIATLTAKNAGVEVVDDRPDASKRELQRVVDEFLAEVEVNKARKTWLAFRQVLGAFTGAVKRRYIEDVTRHDVMVKFMGALRSQNLADRTLYHRFACLVTFLKSAKHPVVALKDAPSYTETQIAMYTPQELQSLFRACSSEERLLFQFFLGTGGREQEVQFAEWSDIDFTHREFRISAKPRLGFKPKDREERVVPMPAVLVQELKMAASTSKSTFLFPKDGKPDGHLIRRLKAVAHRSKLNCGRCVSRSEKGCKDHAVCGRWRLHTFRHTFASMHLQKGVDPRTVQKWMGHSSLATTQKYLDALNLRSNATRTAVDNTFATVMAPVARELPLQ